MKKRSILILCLLLTMLFSLATTASAFDTKKVVFAILDKTSNVDANTANEWRNQITGSLKYPFFEVEKEILMLSPNDTVIGKDQKAFASRLAQATNAKLVFILEVNTFDEWIVTSFGFGDYGDDLLSANINMNAIIYDATANKFLSKKIQDFSTQPIPIADGILKTSKYAFQDVVYTFVGQKDIVSKAGEKSE